MATGAIHRSAPCGIALRGPFTPGTDEVCRTRRAPSRSVRLARLISPSAVHTRSNARTRIWPPHCPTSALKPAPQLARGYMLHAAGHFRRRKLLRAAPTTSAGVVGLNQLQMQGADGKKIQHRISRAAASVANHRAAPRSKALRGPFTPGTDEVCRTRRARKPERAPRPINIPEQRMHTSKC